MNVGFDYWQVLSHYPAHFKTMARAFINLGLNVCVVSAVGKNRAGSVAAAVVGAFSGISPTGLSAAKRPHEYCTYAIYAIR